MQKELKQVGTGLVWFLVIVMILRITSYFMISESAAVTRVFKTGLRSMLTGICFLTYRQFNRGERPTRFAYRNILALGLYINYLFIGFASILWSTDRAWSALQVAMDVECVFFVYYYWKNILVTLDQERFKAKVYLDYVLWVSISWIGFIFIIGSFIDPDLFFRATHGGEVQRLGGFLINPNELGMLLSVGVGALYLNLMRRGTFSIWYAISWIVIVAALGMTQSRSSMISFALVSGYFLFLSGNLKLIIPSIVVGAAVAPVIFFTIFVKEGDVGEVASMTGRLPFWKDLLTYAFPDRPIFGYGFMRIHYLDKFPSIHAYPGAMTHNTFMQVLMNLGVVGATNNFAQMLFTIRAVFRQQDYWLTHTFPAIFFGIFINSLTEFGIFGDANYGIQWWLFCIFSNVLFTNPKPKLARHAPVYSTYAPR